ncbi:MAG TPA: FAD-dependent oxidoreductase, partial [Gemmatimonadota bacterium]|nr:FAD-dependent oxidoreductase [Gemmatimonadota bacterium]
MSRLDAEIAVVGAGAAGLMAARALIEKGLDVVVLEARKRAGGRIFTIRDPDLPYAVELGAEFVHGDAPLTRKILREAGVEVASLEAEQFQARGGRIVPADPFESIERLLDALDGEREPDRSFADFLRSPDAAEFPERDRERALAFVEGFYAADAERVSEGGLAGEGVEGAVSGGRLPAGYDRLVARLADELAGRIRFARVVKRCAWSDDAVTLSGMEIAGRARSKFSVRARAAIFAVPHAVLTAPPKAAAAIAFEPVVFGLDETLSAVETGHVVRLTIATGAPPLELLGASAETFFLHTPAAPFNAFWTVEPPGSPALVAWSGGPRSRKLPRSREERRRTALKVLRDTAGPAGARLAAGAGAAFGHDWSRDPFARGAYCYNVVGAEPPEPVHTGAIAFEPVVFGLDETL